MANGLASLAGKLATSGKGLSKQPYTRNIPEKNIPDPALPPAGGVENTQDALSRQIKEGILKKFGGRAAGAGRIATGADLMAPTMSEDEDLKKLEKETGRSPLMNVLLMLGMVPRAFIKMTLQEQEQKRQEQVQTRRIKEQREFQTGLPAAQAEALSEVGLTKGGQPIEDEMAQQRRKELISFWKTLLSSTSTDDATKQLATEELAKLHDIRTEREPTGFFGFTGGGVSISPSDQGLSPEVATGAEESVRSALKAQDKSDAVIEETIRIMKKNGEL